MRADELARLDAHDQAALIRNGDVSEHELALATIDALDRWNPTLNAVIHRFDKRFVEQARVAATLAPERRGPLHGVPFLLKDIVSASAGDPMHCGMRVLRDERWIEPRDSWLTERFRACGLLLAGRTNTPELATSITCEPIAYGATRNPWSSEHSTGGSSGGSAAAVAAGIVAVAHANDMGGSIRIPAANCALVGLKPSRARSTLGPDLGELWGPLTHEHVVTRSVRDSALVLDAIAGPGIGDPYTATPRTRPFTSDVGADPGRLRIGWRTHIPHNGALAHRDCVAAVMHVAHVLASLGHHVDEDANLAWDHAVQDTSGSGAFFPAVVAAEVDRIGRRLGRVILPQELEPSNAILVEMGRAVRAVEYLEALDAEHRRARQVVAWWHGTDAHDLLLTPTLPTPPLRLGVLDPATRDPFEIMRGVSEQVAFTNMWNDTGQPAISLPLYWNAEGLPIGIQLVAAPGREDVLLQVASQLEAAQPWRDRLPSVPNASAEGERTIRT